MLENGSFDLIDWENILPIFEWDGSWRDIYVLDTSLADWQEVWQLLRFWEPAPKLFLDGLPIPMPEQVSMIFEQKADLGALLSVRIGSITLNCHFFTIDEIEFDLDPREITRLEDASLLANFLKAIGDVTGKSSILTAENGKDAVLAAYAPTSSEITWENCPPYRM